MDRTFRWHFPLPRTHTGMLLGNAILGALVWGGKNVLRVTLNRADHWDHRGGKPWTPEMNYADIRRLLDAKDEPALRALFAVPEQPGTPPRPTVLPFGRLELHFEETAELVDGVLHLDRGQIAVRLRDARGRLREVRMEVAAREPLLLIQLPAGLPVPEVRRVPAWEYVGEHLRSISFEPPELFEGPQLSGWVQKRPADEVVCLGYRFSGRDLWASLVYGPNADAARKNAGRGIARASCQGAAELRRANRAWWKQYWAESPRVRVPNARLDFIYHYGMYKFAGLTAPHGVAATLQGPWVEEYQLPPWSSDYHFNINVQMCYWPACPGNHVAHLRPLLDLVWSWREKLRENARLFVGVTDGYMLPHAVDDRGVCMGAFWTGTVDHGCTAWVAKMMYDYWLYGGDRRFLREVAYPFMMGAMRVYEALLEPDGERLVLPVSVSPEYRGGALNAWGRNASFQLAAIHWLAEALEHAAAVLGETPRPVWAEICRRLPKACVQSLPPGRPPKIMLWEGTDLEESHRHHSHLAGFYPFDVLDLADPEWRQIATTTCRWWLRQGMGQWTGWCVPWASMLQTRIGLPELTEAYLEYWQALFTNEGHGTLHDPLTWTRLRLPEQKAKSPPAVARGFGMAPEREIMQIEAGMAAAAAVLDMLVHVRRGLHYIFPGVPQRWREASFAGIRTEGGFLVSAERRDGVTRHVTFRATRRERLRVANPWPGQPVRIVVGGKSRVASGDRIEMELASGADAHFTPCAPEK